MKKALCGLLIFLAAGGLLASAAKKKRVGNTKDFAYYMLVLSYAPDFCDQSSANKKSAECATGNHTGFVVHGLWPQGETTRGPENCGSGTVSQANLNAMHGYIPTDSLVQHEWTTHGTCTGLSQDDYFALVRKARDSVKIPTDYAAPTSPLSPTPADFAAQFAAANSADPATAFRASCYPNGELQEARICFTKDLAGRPCGSSAGMCNSGNMRMLPTR